MVLNLSTLQKVSLKMELKDKLVLVLKSLAFMHLRDILKVHQIYVLRKNMHDC